MSSRNEQMAAMFSGGMSLQEIGDQYGISRERVRQVVVKFGLNRTNGGKSLLRLKIAELKRVENDIRFMAKNGCTPAESESIPREYKRKYQYQRSNAKNRGIAFNLTLWQWWNIWLESGHLSERGQGMYVMARRGDSGAYEAGNVYICTSSQNIKDSYVFKPACLRAKAAIRHARSANKGYSRVGKKYGVRIAGKWTGHWFYSEEEARKKYLALVGQVVLD